MGRAVVCDDHNPTNPFNWSPARTAQMVKRGRQCGIIIEKNVAWSRMKV